MLVRFVLALFLLSFLAQFTVSYVRHRLGCSHRMAGESMALTDGGSHDVESFGLGTPSPSSFLLATILDMLDTRQVAP